MMKKLLSTIMAMLLLWSFAVSAHAENEFVLRNGIQFGDTKEQVRAKETIAINEKESKGDELITEKENVAGFERVEIVYRFDEKGKLIEVKWDMPWQSLSNSNSDYEKLKNAFQQKYGTPLGYSNGELYIITTTVFDEIAKQIVSMPFIGGTAALLDYSEWDYEYQKGQHVKIDLAQYYIEDKVGNRGYQLKVCYKYFTDEELNTAIQEKKEENAIENANLLNDI